MSVEVKWLDADEQPMDKLDFGTIYVYPGKEDDGEAIKEFFIQNDGAAKMEEVEVTFVGEEPAVGWKGISKEQDGDVWVDFSDSVNIGDIESGEQSDKLAARTVVPYDVTPGNYETKLAVNYIYS